MKIYKNNTNIDILINLLSVGYFLDYSTDKYYYDYNIYLVFAKKYHEYIILKYLF